MSQNQQFHSSILDVGPAVGKLKKFLALTLDRAPTKPSTRLQTQVSQRPDIWKPIHPQYEQGSIFPFHSPQKPPLQASGKS